MATSEDELMRALHTEHASALFSYALRLTSGDRSWAEDVVQEALLRAWRNPHVLDPDRGSPRAWLFTVAHRIVIDQWRARQVRPEVVAAEPPELIGPDEAERAVQSWTIVAALNRLSTAHREVLVECFYAGRSTSEAAAMLGVPPGTVKSRMHYALRALKLVLEEMGVTE